MAKIAIIGAGNVGANTAFFLAERNVGPVLLCDVQEGLAIGKALDLMEAAPVRGFQHGIHPAGVDEAIASADIVMLAAGAIRAPGETRDTLAARNAELIDSFAAALKGFGGTVVVATEPVDAMVMRLVDKAGLSPKKVLGVGGVLDANRFRRLLSEAIDVSYENVTAMVIGRHSPDMLVLTDYARVSGVPVSMVLSDEKLAAVVAETRTSGDNLVEKLQRSSSYYGPAAAATDVIQAVAWDTKRILPVSFLLDGQYGITGVAMSLPAVIGAAGIERVLEPKLSTEQVRALNASADQLAALAGTV